MVSDPLPPRDADRGTGLPILLVHGFPLCSRMWDPQVTALQQAGYRVLVPDLPGFGGTPAAAPPWTMGRFADSVIELLDHLALEQVVVGGMSMGGYVLLDLLVRHPRRVAAAIFIATRAGGDDPAGRIKRTRLAEAALAGDLAAITNTFSDILFAGETPRQRPDLVAQVQDWMAQASPAGLAAGLLAMRDRADYVGRLQEFGLPTLVIGGAEDRAIAQDQFQILVEGLPASRSCLIPGGGHLVNLEQPAGFNTCLLAFLAGLKGS